MRHFIDCFKNLTKERNELVMKYAFGCILDIGCGEENYIEKHRPRSIGIDKNDKFPLNNLFDTVTMVASFNYMEREDQCRYLGLIKKILAPRGKLIITCVTPFGSFLKRLGGYDGETENGIRKSDLINRLRLEGFRCIFTRSFNFGLNNLFVFIN